MTHSDSFIDHWGEVFHQSGIGRLLEIDLAEFLSDPRGYCAAAAVVCRTKMSEFAELLPPQQNVQARLDAEGLKTGEVDAALKRLDAGTSTSKDATLIRRALSLSSHGRRMLDSLDVELPA